MNFCIIVRNSDGFIFGSEYEPYYEYSEYTSGGDCWNFSFIPRSVLADQKENHVKMHIFENYSAAEKFMELNKYYFSNNCSVVLMENL